MLDLPFIARFFLFLIPAILYFSCGFLSYIASKNVGVFYESKMYRTLSMYYAFGIPAILYVIVLPLNFYLFVSFKQLFLFFMFIINIFSFEFIHILTLRKNEKQLTYYRFIIPGMAFAIMEITYFLLDPADPFIVGVVGVSIICLYYIYLTIKRLRDYNKGEFSSVYFKVAKKTEYFLVIMVLLFTVVCISGLYIRRVGLGSSILLSLISITLVGMHILLIFRLLRRKYNLLTLQGNVIREERLILEHKEPKIKTAQKKLPVRKKVKKKPDESEVETNADKPETVEKKKAGSKKRKAVKLTKRKLEGYLAKHKPYLNPNFKITDLVTMMKINRTYLSNFVNKTYNVNFAGYINMLRLGEFDALKRVPENWDKTDTELSKAVGFTSLRNYQRARKWFEDEGLKTDKQ